MPCSGLEKAINLKYVQSGYLILWLLQLSVERGQAKQAAIDRRHPGQRTGFWDIMLQRHSQRLASSIGLHSDPQRAKVMILSKENPFRCQGKEMEHNGKKHGLGVKPVSAALREIYRTGFAQLNKKNSKEGLQHNFNNI